MALSEMNHWRRALAVACIAIFVVSLMGGLLAAAVGGGGTLAVAASAHDDGHRASASSSSTTSSGGRHGRQSDPSASDGVPNAVVAQADKALLQLSDMPSGWASGGAAVAPSRTSPWSKQLASCADVAKSIAAIKPTKISSPDYTSSDQTLAMEDAISLYPTATEAQQAYTALDSTKTPRCMNRIGSEALRASVQNEAGSNATVGTVTIAPLAPGSYEAHETGYTVTIPLDSQGRQLTITSTLIDFVHGRFNEQLTFNGNGATFPPLLEVHLIRVAKAKA